MPKAVSVTEAKDRLDALLGDVAQHGDEVVLEIGGEPRAVLIPFAVYREIAASRERQRRADALARLEQLAQRVRARNTDLSFDQAEAIAEELSQAAIARLAERRATALEPTRP